MYTGLDKSPLEERNAKGKKFFGIRCTSGCRRLLCVVSMGAIDPQKTEIRCEQCGQSLKVGVWQTDLSSPEIRTAIYRCPSCAVVHEKTFEGIGLYCKKCHTNRYVFLATNSNPAVMIGDWNVAS